MRISDWSSDVCSSDLKGCKCGDVSMPATTKVTWNNELHQAALAHAKDMHANNYFNHTSPAGENVYNRLKQSGYIDDSRSEERRAGKESVSTGRSRWSTNP